MKKFLFIILTVISHILHSQTFTDISDSINLPLINGLGYQGVWLDYNNDDYPDILGESENGTFLFKNNEGLNFIDVTNISGLSGVFFSSVSTGDINNDGWVDLLLNRNVYKNLNGNSFQLVYTINEYPERTILTDIDGNGLLDIIGVGGNPSIVIYKNLGNCNFINITSSFNLPNAEAAITCTSADLDNDGFEDLYIGRYNKPNLLLKNIAGADYLNISIFNGFGDPMGSVSVSTGDFNNDGLLDIYVGNIGSVRNTLYRNLDNLFFSDVTLSANVRDDGDARTASFIDYNNDGLLDIFTTNHVHSNKLFKNNGNGTFSNVAANSGISSPQDGFGVSWADFDNDGDIDVVIVGHENRRINLLKNNGGNSNSFLQIKLVGTYDNKIGIGCIVEIYHNGRYQKRQLTAGEGNTGQNYYIIHFGLGNSSKVDSLIIKWPSGAQQKLYNVLANQRLTIVENVNIPPKVFRLISPINNYLVTDSILTFQWSPSTDPDSNHTIFYYLRIFNNEVDTLIGPLYDTTFIYNMNSIKSSANDFFWFVTASDGIDIRRSWEKWSFRRINTSVLNYDNKNINNELSIKILPNPTNSNINFFVNLKNNGIVSLKIFDILGNLITTPIDNKLLAAGSHSFYWELKNRENRVLSSGIYFCVLNFSPLESNKNYSEVKKVIIIR